MENVILPLIGGALIGLAATLMLIFNGRVTGISGIIGSAMTTSKKDGLWRWSFLLGLGGGGVLLSKYLPESLSSSLSTGWPQLAIAGFLVGFGTLLGSGCTSGHGVCGVSRLSPRSLAATAFFISAGILTVTLMKNF